MVKQRKIGSILVNELSFMKHQSCLLLYELFVTRNTSNKFDIILELFYKRNQGTFKLTAIIPLAIETLRYL